MLEPFDDYKMYKRTIDKTEENYKFEIGGLAMVVKAVNRYLAWGKATENLRGKDIKYLGKEE